jgi:hypothetical protein
MAWQLWALVGVAVYILLGLIWSTRVRCWLTDHQWLAQSLFNNKLGEKCHGERCTWCGEIRWPVWRPMLKHTEEPPRDDGATWL